MSAQLAELERYFAGAASLLELGRHADERGSLLALEFATAPFAPQRAFVVSGVPEGTSRGGHAHLSGSQLLICLAGSVSVEMRLGPMADRVELTGPTMALLLGEQVWARQSYSGPEAVLLVLASAPYDAGSYLRREAGEAR